MGLADALVILKTLTTSPSLPARIPQASLGRPARLCSTISSATARDRCSSSATPRHPYASVAGYETADPGRVLDASVTQRRHKRVGPLRIDRDQQAPRRLRVEDDRPARRVEARGIHPIRERV